MKLSAHINLCSLIGPRFWNVWDSYGEGLAKDGNTIEATQAYKKSLELNPENKAGTEMLIKLSR